MIDHVSVPVRDIVAARKFYDAVLRVLGYSRLIEREGMIGYGKLYPEFWINLRETWQPSQDMSGMHICLRASDAQTVEAFHQTALAEGGGDDGGPGARPEYSQFYYAAFVRDLDGNRIEAVTFV